MPRIRIVRICAAEITVRVRPEQALQLSNVEVARWTSQWILISICLNRTGGGALNL
jgi:hypothetical protein